MKQSAFLSSRIIRAMLALVVVVVSVSACGGGAAASSQTISISGAFALYPMVVSWSEEYQKLHPSVQFDIQAGGAGKGMSDVLAGAVDLAMVSREVRAEEAQQGAVAIGVVKDAVVGTVSAQNPALGTLQATGLTPDKAAGIWMRTDITTWGALVGSDDASEIHLYTRADACGAAEMWAKYMGGTAQEDLQGIAVQGDPGVGEAVRQDALGIGFNNLNFAFDATSGKPVDGLAIVPLDLNGDGQITPDENFYATELDVMAAIADGRYPSPPARVLYLVTKGTPTGAAADFIRWALTDGQAFVQQSGYVTLTADQLQQALGLLGQ